MTKKQGDRLSTGVVKTSILTYIFQNDGPVEESAIREFLLDNFNVVAQSSINRHLNDLRKVGCLELIEPLKKGLKNKWDIKTLKNLRNIKHEFPGLQLNEYEKSITVILQEHRYVMSSPVWLKHYIQLRVSSSFFDACIKNSIDALDRGFVKMYRLNIDFHRNQQINDLLKVCYLASVKYHSDLKTSDETFTKSMRGIPWEIYIDFTEDMIPKNMLPDELEQFFPALPEEIPRLFFKTRLVGLKEIPDEIPDEIIKEDIGKYALEALRLIIDQKLDLRASMDVLQLEHFFNHDIITGVVSEYESYFVKQTNKNHTLPRGSTEPCRMNLKEAELADLRLASEMILNYKQPSKFSVSDSFDEIYQTVLKFYSFRQIQQ